MPEDDIALLTQNLQLRKPSTRDTHDFEKGRAMCLAAVGVRKSGLNEEWLVRSPSIRLRDMDSRKPDISGGHLFPSMQLRGGEVCHAIVHLAVKITKTQGVTAW